MQISMHHFDIIFFTPPPLHVNIILYILILKLTDGEKMLRMLSCVDFQNEMIIT